MNHIKNEIGSGEWTHLEQAPADIIDPEIIPTHEDWQPQNVDVSKTVNNIMKEKASKSKDEEKTGEEEEEEEDFND